MKAGREDKIMDAPGSRGFPMAKLMMAVLAVVLLIVVWFAMEPEAPAPSASSTSDAITPAPQSKLAVAPDIPQRPVTVALGENTEVIAGEAGSQSLPDSITPSAALPAYSISDSQAGDDLLREQMTQAAADDNLKQLAGDERPLEVSAILIDGLGKGLILRKILPARPPSKPFEVVEEGESIFMSNTSYERYDGYVDSIMALNVPGLVDGFHTLRPLYEKAYGQLGLDPSDFDNAVIRLLDLILATPEIEGPIRLQRKSIRFAYDEQALESLPAVQKQLLRMGPDNIRRVKQQAQRIRASLLAK